MTDILKVSNLVKRYEGFALKGVNLCVSAGCVVGFVGSNGAGKTTTIKSILGLVVPNDGTIELFGEPVSAQGASLARAKARMGVVFDTCPFPSESRMRDVRALGRMAFPTWDNAVFDAYLSQFGIDEKKQVKSLSRGMGMKLQLAFALAHAPELLVLDEVTAGLDPLAREEVLDILRAFMENERHGILMSSHITSDLEKIADYVVCIDAGHEVFSCTIDEICDVAGIARCRAAEAEALMTSGLFGPGSLRVMRNDYFTDVLVPDRAALRRAFPDVACERVSLESYMLFMLKGEPR